MAQASPQSLRSIRIVGFVLLSTVPLYFLCAEFLVRSQERVILPAIKNALTLVALLTFLVVLLLRFRFLPDPSRATSPSEIANMAMRLRMVSMQGMVWSESVALFGFVLRFLGASRNYTLPFYLLGAFGILLFLRSPAIHTGGTIR
jgi:hypothetical protein